MPTNRSPQGQRQDSSRLKAEATRLRRDAEKSTGRVGHIELIGHRLPPMLQFRSGVGAHQVSHGEATDAAGTAEPWDFEVDPRHLRDLTESLRPMKSPVHLRRIERPLAVHLTEPIDFEGTRYVAGSMVIVEGLHRIAAAWANGWRSIPINIIDGGQRTVDLLIVSANKSPSLAAKSHEDLFRALRLLLDRDGTLPSVKESAALLQVSDRTIKRVRSEYREQLDLGQRSESQMVPDPVAPRYTKAHVASLRKALTSAGREARSLGPEGTANMLLSALLNVPQRHQEAALAGLSRALQYRGIDPSTIKDRFDIPDDDNDDF